MSTWSFGWRRDVRICKHMTCLQHIFTTIHADHCNDNKFELWTLSRCCPWRSCRPSKHLQAHMQLSRAQAWNMTSTSTWTNQSGAPSTQAWATLQTQTSVTGTFSHDKWQRHNMSSTTKLAGNTIKLLTLSTWSWCTAISWKNKAKAESYTWESKQSWQSQNSNSRNSTLVQRSLVTSNEMHEWQQQDTVSNPLQFPDAEVLAQSPLLESTPGIGKHQKAIWNL